MRRLTQMAVASIATAALAFTVTGCGDDSGDGDSGKGGADKGAALAYDIGGRGDLSFNDAAAAGFDQAKKEFGWEGMEVEPNEGETDADKIQRLTDLAKKGYNPVIAVGFVYSKAVGEVSKKFPKTNFGIIDDPVEGKNIANLVFNEEQASYLAGVAAAKVTKSKTVGFIGGVETPLIKKFEAGYVQGVKDTDSSVKVEVKYLTQPPDFSGFADPAKGKSAAEGQLDAGADVIYHAAGGAGNGAIEAAATAGKWAIGVDSDQYNAPTLAKFKDKILASATKNATGAVYNLIKSVHDKKPQSGEQRYGLKGDGVGLTESNPAYTAMTDVVEAVNAAKAKIVSGEITVKTEP
ncbi:Membrane lipoprotein TmpC [Streptomyces sp. RB5]|uniref:Membrane lipoprotein TmpC n=1 Tax=Streptomyces smaragdinus TaxID=2585196 RepID=A0A7K0CR07_9ACTN|nr:BMP family ABC transporter substrate-binding protein [Streptomyces smaragdinus]MQY15910.1 Membrane lipoprotein TmpC [Streptomyces smaragdinus]